MSLDEEPKNAFDKWKAKEDARTALLDKKWDEEFQTLFDDADEHIHSGSAQAQETTLVRHQPIDSATNIRRVQSDSVTDQNEEPIARYSFESVDARVLALTQAELLEELESVLESFKSPSDYPAIRQSYCSLSIALNERGMLAPAFRRYPSIPKKGERDEHQLLMQRDRVFIDTHWLFTREERLSASDGERNWEDLVNLRKPFNWEMAESFASANINNDYRAGSIFNMTPLQQSQTLSFRTSSFYARWDTIKKGRGSGPTRQRGVLQLVGSALNQWGEVNVRLKKETYRAYAMSVLLLGPDGLQRQVAALAGFILGEIPLKESRARKILKTLFAKVPELASHNPSHTSAPT